jgi:hypothetical protein
MDNNPQDPHDTPADQWFPSLPHEMRQEMMDFLDGYCEVAFQVWTRLEEECTTQKATHSSTPRVMIDIVKKIPH